MTIGPVWGRSHVKPLVLHYIRIVAYLPHLRTSASNKDGQRKVGCKPFTKICTACHVADFSRQCVVHTLH